MRDFRIGDHVMDSSRGLGWAVIVDIEDGDALVEDQDCECHEIPLSYLEFYDPMDSVDERDHRDMPDLDYCLDLGECPFDLEG